MRHFAYALHVDRDSGVVCVRTACGVGRQHGGPEFLHLKFQARTLLLDLKQAQFLCVLQARCVRSVGIRVRRMTLRWMLGLAPAVRATLLLPVKPARTAASDSQAPASSTRAASASSGDMDRKLQVYDHRHACHQCGSCMGLQQPARD